MSNFELPNLTECLGWDAFLDVIEPFQIQQTLGNRWGLSDEN
jgi:hypothetical protein